MKKILSILLLLVVTAPAAVSADKADSANKKGIEAYSEKKFDESVGHFTEAAVERPESPELKFNLGTALSEQTKADEALTQLGAAAESFRDDGKRAAARYNAGNTRFLSGDLEGSIEDFSRAVKLDQDSRDIRHNLEVAVRKIKQQQQQQQKQNDDQQQKKDDEQKQDDEDKQSETKETDQKDQEDKEQQQSDQQDSEDRPMTPEEAKRILDALNDEEKQALSLRRMKMKTEMRQGDDW